MPRSGAMSACEPDAWVSHLSFSAMALSSAMFTAVMRLTGCEAVPPVALCVQAVLETHRARVEALEGTSEHPGPVPISNDPPTAPCACKHADSPETQQPAEQAVRLNACAPKRKRLQSTNAFITRVCRCSETESALVRAES